MSDNDLFGPDNKEYMNTPVNSPHLPPNIKRMNNQKNKSTYNNKKKWVNYQSQNYQQSKQNTAV